MALHPQCKAFLEQLAASGAPPLERLTPAELRAGGAPPDVAGPFQAIHAVADRQIPGPGGPLAVRVYTPREGTALPGVVYFHGGGFILGGLDSGDRACRLMAHGAGCVIVAVDYRLAPEHPFPAAADDAYAATCYVAEHAASFNIDPSRLAVAGDSAGGNLAAGVTIRAREAGGPRLVFQLLVYPQVDFNDDSPSMRQFGEGHFITRPAIESFATHYFRSKDERATLLASPLHASLDRLPPAFILTAECDPLRDQGEAYADKLRQAGVPVTLKRYDGMIHPFFTLAGVIDGGKQAIADATAALGHALAR